MILDYTTIEIEETNDGKIYPRYLGVDLYDTVTKKPMYDGQPVLFKNVPDYAHNWFKKYSVENQTEQTTKQTSYSSDNYLKSLQDKLKTMYDDLATIESEEKAKLKKVRDDYRKKKKNKKSDIEKVKNMISNYVMANNPDIKKAIDEMLNV